MSIDVTFQDDEEGGGGVGGPVFDQKSPANVTAVKGKVAQLACKVLGLGNRTVSLTSGSSINDVKVYGGRGSMILSRPHSKIFTVTEL